MTMVNSGLKGLSKGPEKSREKNAALSRVPKYLGAECVFLVFLSLKSMWSCNHGGNLFFLMKVCFSFDCAWIAPHDNIWADVELSFLKVSIRTKN